MRVGIKLSQNAPIEDYLQVWRFADEGGFDHVWVMDHLATLGPDDDGPIFDAWALLAAMAVATDRVRIGRMVTGNTYRHPGVLAKLATTVDHLSGGRLEFGVGAGWAEREHAMYGLQFGTVGDRMDRLEEALGVITSLWTEPRTSFDGRHYRLEAAVAEPKPVQQPHPPIWIGGSGRRRTLRMVARYADAWNYTGDDIAEFAELAQVLDGHCADVGRDPAEIRRTVQHRLGDDLDALSASCRAYAAAGASEFVLVLPWGGGGRQALDLAAQALPRLRELG
ncbi:LLM class F420-dependent oxidoreductase [Xylanimonas sp. McL0601]|uniref:LLM class F420-dependent oxidoreductase n=1 Tax=Xylanimonas sp. McL0601 TaxID=3414739 RepID=UPI003CF9D9A3